MAAVTRHSFEAQLRDKLSNSRHGYADHAAHVAKAPVQARVLRREAEKMVYAYFAAGSPSDTTQSASVKDHKTGATITFTPVAGTAPRISA